MSSRSKISFLRRVLKHRFKGQPRLCPYCQRPTKLALLGRKKFLLEILRCDECLLVFRWPSETTDEGYAYYQRIYESGATTGLPGSEQLCEMAKNVFRGSPNLDISPKISVVKTLKEGGRALDYGCSWGYGVYQLLHYGYSAVGFEVSEPRARFGRQRLGVTIIDQPDVLCRFPEGSFDLIFTNHVLEHLPEIGKTLSLFSHLLSDGGLMFSVLPNFTGRTARNGAFWTWIGEAHPIAPTYEFFLRNLARHGFVRVICASSPFNDELAYSLSRQPPGTFDLEGDELLVVASKRPLSERQGSPVLP